jgi:AcrR family transcriptional regulator
MVGRKKGASLTPAGNFTIGILGYTHARPSRSNFMRPTKRDELVGRALQAFYAHGFHATGMDRLVEMTGISKTSMYKHFRSKEDLILAALERRDREFRGWLFGRMAALGKTPRDQLLALFDALGEWFEEPAFRGCMFVMCRRPPTRRCCSNTCVPWPRRPAPPTLTC